MPGLLVIHHNRVEDREIHLEILETEIKSRWKRKWIPSMTASWKNSTSRGKELSGFKSWWEQFSGWLCLIHDACGPELREAINSADPIR